MEENNVHSEILNCFEKMLFTFIFISSNPLLMAFALTLLANSYSEEDKRV